MNTQNPSKMRQNHILFQRANFRKPGKPKKAAAGITPGNSARIIFIAGTIGGENGNAKKLPEKPEIKKRLAYSMSDAAEILGVHYIPGHRLIQRDLP